MNRLVRPLQFAFEPDVVTQFTKMTFGAAGAVTLDTLNSKGVCDVTKAGAVVTGNTTNLSATISNVSSFAGLAIGASIAGAGIPVSTVILTLNPTLRTMTISNAATATASAVALTVTATGIYTVTFGSQFTPFKRLDAYVKLLGLHHVMQPAVGLSSIAPAMFLVSNDVSQGDLASITLQFGHYAGNVFTPLAPASGEKVFLEVKLCRSNAM